MNPIHLITSVVLVPVILIGCSQEQYSDSDRQEFVQSCIPIAKSEKGETSKKIVEAIGTEKLCDCAWGKTVKDITYSEYKELGLGQTAIAGIFACAMEFAGAVDQFNSPSAQ